MAGALVRVEAIRGRLLALQARVRAADATFRAPNMMKRHLSTEERLGNLQPEEFTVTLHISGRMTPENRETIARLFRASDRGETVTVYMGTDAE